MVGLPGLKRASASVSAFHGGLSRFLTLLPSSSGNTWLAQAARSHASTSSATFSGYSSARFLLSVGSSTRLWSSQTSSLNGVRAFRQTTADQPSRYMPRWPACS